MDIKLFCFTVPKIGKLEIKRNVKIRVLNKGQTKKVYKVIVFSFNRLQVFCFAPYIQY